MSKAIIGVDIDGVLCNTGQAMIDYYNSLSGDNLTLLDIKNYYIEEYVKPEWKKDFHKLFLDNKFWKTVKVINDAQKYVDKLIDNDYRIVLVTSTEPYNFYKKSRWLSRMFPKINLRDNLISCKDKQLMSSYIDILIDDYPKNLQNKYDNYGNYLTADYIKIMFDHNGQYAWTKEFKCNNVDSFRVHNWQETYDLICALSDEVDIQDVVYDMATDTYM